MHEYWGMKDRLPPAGLLVHHFETDGVPMVEVHVDLDDSFDLERAQLPLGGRFSVRFPGRRPTDSALRPPPAGLPSPGAGLTDVPPPREEEQEPTDPMEVVSNDHPPPPPPQLPTEAAIEKLTVVELKGHLKALRLAVGGRKQELKDRLLEAVRTRQDPNQASSQDLREESEESGEEEWKVKKILDRRVSIDVVNAVSFDVVEYQIQWDWPDDDDPTKDEVTWEKEGNLTNAIEALHEFLSAQPKQPNCTFNHIQGVCRCALPLIHSGQDESIFKAYQKSQYQWVVQGVRGLRKKTDGPGEMVSGFKDELRGFGHPLNQEELSLMNSFRKVRGRDPLSTSPAVRFLSYGKNKEGYWKYENFAEQVVDILDMYESLYPNAQVLLEVDWSSGHSKHREDALNVASMSVNFGGKQAIPHPSRMVQGCLGEQGALLKEGEMQYFYFRSVEDRRDAGATDGQPDPPPFYKPDLQPSEYVGMAKGKKHILFERGLWKTGMVEKIDDDDPRGRDKTLSMDYVLGSCTDFRNETGALQTLVESRGHILVMSPKGHCELAGDALTSNSMMVSCVRTACFMNLSQVMA